MQCLRMSRVIALYSLICKLLVRRKPHISVAEINSSVGYCYMSNIFAFLVRSDDENCC